jgi:hypothetical protein
MNTLITNLFNCSAFFLKRAQSLRHYDFYHIITPQIWRLPLLYRFSPIILCVALATPMQL